MAQQRLQVEKHSWWWLLTRTQIPMLKNNIIVTVKQLHNGHLYLGTEENGHCREVVITQTFPIYIYFFFTFFNQIFLMHFIFYRGSPKSPCAYVTDAFSCKYFYYYNHYHKKSKKCNYYFLNKYSHQWDAQIWLQ